MPRPTTLVLVSASFLSSCLRPVPTGVAPNDVLERCALPTDPSTTIAVSLHEGEYTYAEEMGESGSERTTTYTIGADGTLRVETEGRYQPGNDTPRYEPRTSTLRCGSERGREAYRVAERCLGVDPVPASDPETERDDEHTRRFATYGLSRPGGDASASDERPCASSVFETLLALVGADERADGEPTTLSLCEEYGPARDSSWQCAPELTLHPGGAFACRVTAGRLTPAAARRSIAALQRASRGYGERDYPYGYLETGEDRTPIGPSETERELLRTLCE